MSTFLRVVALHRQGASVEEIAFLTQSSVRLVKEYLKVYEAAIAKPHRREKLEEEMVRVSPSTTPSTSLRAGLRTGARQETPSEEGEKGGMRR